MAVWINEFHYDNASTDVGEFIEIAGTAGTDLTGWSLVLYNGNPTQRLSYNTIALSGVIDNESNGFGALSFSAVGLQNGGFPNTDVEPDGIALFDGTNVVQFLSYEGNATNGTFTAANGVANGQTSVNIGVGVAEAGTEAVGGSLQLTGFGDDYGDFTWSKTTDDTPGSINPSQTFPALVNESVFVNDVSVTEGDGGTTLLTFTVTRSGNAGAFTIDFTTADGSATLANNDYAIEAGTLSFAAGGALSQQVVVDVTGDVAAEPDETLTLTLSGLIDITGTTTISDGQATGTILNDDLLLTEIGAIQGAGHKAPSVGGAVGSFGNSGTTRFNVEGVVTARTTNGFWIQDADGDGDLATSDGIFVFTSTAPAATITLGETVRLLNVQVNEFRPGGSGGTNNLTVTQLTASTGTLVELGGDTPITPVVLGVDRLIPTGQVEDDGFTSFDITTDAIDFWESLEGMVVTIPTSVAISPTSEFRTRDPANSANAEGPPTEEIWVRIPGNTDPAGLTPSGGLLLGETDVNPERIQIDDLTAPVDLPDVNVGDTIGPVTGVVSYDFTNYEVLTGTAPVVTTTGSLAPETTTLAADSREVTIASYNVLNLDPVVESTAAGAVAGSDLYTRLGESDDDVGDGQYAAIAFDIAVALGAPTIVALQEIQDSDGATISGVLDANLTLQTLVDLLETTYGIDYDFVEVAPTTANTNGGQPNANIRNAFLYQADVVKLQGAFLLTDPNPAEADGFAGDDLASSRKPLVGQFRANGVDFTVVNNHFNSKGGDNGIYGNAQPPVLSSEAQRIEIARIVNSYVDGLEAADANTKVVVLGDINDFAFSAPFDALTGVGVDQVLFDLATEKLPADQRYNYNFQGNSQDLDHILVNDILLDGTAFDIVRINAEFSDGTSDHDPLLALLDLRAFDEKLAGTNGADTIDGGDGRDNINGKKGADVIIGGEGNDALKGGAGADVFAFAPGSGKDKLRDFADGIDLIDLSAYAAIDDVADLAIVYDANGAVIDIPGQGGGEITLDGVLAGQLTNADFLFA